MIPHTRLAIVILTFSMFAFFLGCGDDDPASSSGPDEDKYSLGMIRADWTLASTPLLKVGPGGDGYTRGTIRWHNPPLIARADVYDEDAAQGEGTISALRIIFRPHGYRYTGVPDPCADSTESRSWGGIMRPWQVGLPMRGVGDPHLEFRAKGYNGTLRFEFGRINENIDGDTVSDNEGLWHDYEEDTGLDDLMDQSETGLCGEPYDALTNPDPAGDNWWFDGYGKGAGGDNEQPPVDVAYWSDPTYRAEVEDPNHWRHYEWINGTEGNMLDILAYGRMDREDIDGDGLDIVDAYMAYAVSLDTTDANPFHISGSGYNGWHTYRVRLLSIDNYTAVRSDPALEVDWEYVTHLRVWIEQPEPGVDSLLAMDSIWIADWRLVGE